MPPWNSGMHPSRLSPEALRAPKPWHYLLPTPRPAEALSQRSTPGSTKREERAREVTPIHHSRLTSSWESCWVRNSATEHGR